MRKVLLLVEDDPDVGGAVVDALRPFASVVVVKDVRAAVRTLKTLPIDVVLSDYDLQDEWTGAELLGAVSVVWPNIRRVLYSAAMPDSEQVIAHVVLPKPVNLAALLSAVLPS